MCVCMCVLSACVRVCTSQRTLVPTDNVTARPDGCARAPVSRVHRPSWSCCSLPHKQSSCGAAELENQPCAAFRPAAHSPGFAYSKSEERRQGASSHITVAPWYDVRRRKSPQKIGLVRISSRLTGGPQKIEIPAMLSAR